MNGSTPTALVLTGGSARGAFIAGVIRSLVVEHQLDPAVVAGVSIGALNAAHLAVAPRGDVAALHAAAQDLESRWRSGFDHAWWQLLTQGRRVQAVQGSLASMDLEAIRRSDRQWFGGATDATSGRWVCATNADIDHPRLQGILSFPGLLPPVPVGDALWMDGVLRRVVPMREVLATGVKRLVVITGGEPAIERWSGRMPILRALRIAMHELLFLKDVRTPLELDGLQVEIYAPTVPLASPWRFDRAALHRSLDHGLEVGRTRQTCDPALFLG